MAQKRLAFRRQYATAIARGVSPNAKGWAEGFQAKAEGRFTWYVALRVRQDVSGQVSDLSLADVDDRQRSRVVTVALLGVVRSGPRSGELRRLTRNEVERDFDALLTAAIRRHGLVPVNGNPVRGIFRHREG